MTIRPAEPADVSFVFAQIRELASYERAPERVVGDERLLGEALFGADPVAEVAIAELDRELAINAEQLRAAKDALSRAKKAAKPPPPAPKP